MCPWSRRLPWGRVGMMQRNKIAVTGGIGSGKTAVCCILSELGYPVFSCDEISRELWKKEKYLKTLAEVFPTCTEEGKIVKEKLSALIFSDAEQRRKLETVSHPRIMRELLNKMNGYAVCFAEVPLLFEGGYDKFFDSVILVKRETEKRIASVMQRDKSSEEEVKRKIAAQLSDREREKEGIVVVENNGSLEELKAAVKSALCAIGV